MGVRFNARGSFLMAASAWAFLVSGQAYAQETVQPPASMTNAKGVEQLEEVVVTAQKRTERLQDVPVAVTAITAAMLDKLQTKDVTDLTSRVPNLNVQAEEDGPNTASVFIRGIGFQDLEKSFDPPIGVVLDGVYLGTNTGQLLQTFDFASIQVLRGPQGTLFGKNTTGGAIVVQRSLPDGDDINGKVDFTAGNFGRNDYKALINIPIIKDELWVKIAGISENDDGYIRNIVNSDAQGARDYKQGTFTVVWKPTPQWDTNFTYDRIVDLSDAPPYISVLTASKEYYPISDPVDGQLYGGQDTPCIRFNICGNYKGSLSNNIADTSFKGILHFFGNALTENVTYHMNDFDIVSTTGYRDSSEHSVVDFGATPYTYFVADRPQTYSQFTEELRATSKFAGPVNFVAGLFYFESEYTAQQDTHFDLASFDAVSGSPFGVPALQYFTGNATKQYAKSYAVFGQGYYNFTDDLKLTVGGRYTDDFKTFSFTPLNESGYDFLGSSAAGPPIKSHSSWGTFTPTGSLSYKFSKDVLAYASYAKGYNSGGYNGRGTSGATIGPYGPEYVDSYEIGIKTETSDHRLIFNAAAFHSEYAKKQQAIIITDPIAGTATIVRNISGEEINGLELEATALPFQGLTLNGSLGYLDAHYTSFTANLLGPNPFAASGLGAANQTIPSNNDALRPIRSPKYTISAEADYSFDIGPGTTTLVGSMHYTDPYEVDPLNDPRAHVPGETIVDLSVAYDVPFSGENDLRVTAFVKNLTDKVFVNSFVDSAGGAFAFAGTSIGRTYGIDLTEKF